MYIRYSLLICFLAIFNFVESQDLLVYHGRNGETTVYDVNWNSISDLVLKKKKGDVISVRILNPNSLFYKYEIKYEESEMESEGKEITDLLTTLGTDLLARAVRPKAGGAPGAEPTFKDYKDKIVELIGDINTAKKHITDSDIPELPEEALNLRRVAGLRRAIDNIAALSSSNYRFNDPELLAHLNTLCNSINVLDDYVKQGLLLLNASLVQNVNSIKKAVTDQAVPTIIKASFNVTEKKGEIYLAIDKIDPSNATLRRDLHPGNNRLKLATVIPYYERATLEIVPVGNFLFAGNENEFFVDNGLVQSREVVKTRFMAGAVLNANVAKFGEIREMAAGLGIGYNFAEGSNALNNFYFSALFSYKNVFRIGGGFGFAQYPNGLKDGVKIGSSLPDNITNLEDIIEYKEKPTFFLTVALAGLSLTKKK